MIVRHRKKDKNIGKSHVTDEFDFETVSHFVSDGQKKTLLVQTAPEFIPYSNEFRLAILGALEASTVTDAKDFFIGFLADNASNSSHDIPSCCCVEARLASIFQSQMVDGVLLFGPACSIVCSLPVFTSGENCSCSKVFKSVPLLYVPRRIRLSNEILRSNSEAKYIQVLKNELMGVLKQLSQDSSHRNISFVFGESIAYYLVPILKMLISMRGHLVATNFECRYSTTAASESLDFLEFSQNLLMGSHISPDPLQTSNIGLIPVALDASVYFVFSLWDPSLENNLPGDMAIPAINLLVARNVLKSEIYISNAYNSLRRENIEKVKPFWSVAPVCIQRRVKQLPFLIQSLIEAPVVGIFLLNSTVYSGTNGDSNNSLTLSRLLRYYLNILAGKKVYEFYFSSASSSSISDAGSEQTEESPSAAFLTKFSHFLPQLSIGIVVTDCVHKIFDVIESCVQKKYPIPILTPLEALEALQTMIPKSEHSSIDEGPVLTGESISPSLQWDQSFIKYIFKSQGAEGTTSQNVKPSQYYTMEQLIDIVLPHALVQIPPNESLLFSPSFHALTVVFRSRLKKELPSTKSTDYTMRTRNKIVEDSDLCGFAASGQLSRSANNSIASLCENLSQFSMVSNPFHSVQLQERSYTGLDISAGADVEPEIRMGKAGIPASYHDIVTSDI